MESARGQELSTSDVLSAYRNIELLVKGAVSLTQSGFDRNELCLLAAEPAAAVELGLNRFGCVTEDPEGREPDAPTLSKVLGPLVMVEPDQAPPGEALAISQGALCTRMQALALVTGGSADIGTVLGYCLVGEDWTWALSRLSGGDFLLCVHAPTEGVRARAVDLLRAAGAEDIRAIDHPPQSDKKEALG